MRELTARGIAAIGVAFPACHLLKGRARFCLSAAHTREMLEKTLATLDEVGDLLRLKYSNQNCWLPPNIKNNNENNNE
uniref:Aminotransferase class I/classII domain-containing protein n=1 Tax=Strigamia maritima TaxID=126957 RepID=T1J6M1_STRMM